MINKPSKSGFYWVRLKTVESWEIIYFTPNEFYQMGTDEYLELEEIAEIDYTEITREK